MLPWTMQTFLPLPSFVESAKVLDYRRLGKQRVEAMQILTALSKGSGWSNHPAIKMWRGFEPALIVYKTACIDEWISRGYRNSMQIIRSESFELPPWFGNPTFHASHRSNLHRKHPDHYSKFGWSESNDLPYMRPL